MVNLSFVELSEKQLPRKEKPSNNTFSFCLVNHFITNVSFEKEKVANDVTDNVINGSYLFKSKYNIIFLYDFYKNNEARDFIELYGGQLHNLSSSNVTILTYFSPEMATNWKNVQCRERISVDKNNNPEKILDIVNDLKDLYNVANLPAMVVIKKDGDNDEESCLINVSSYKKDNLYATFKEVIDCINNNCEEEFEIIRSKISGPTSEISKNKNSEYFTTYNFIFDKVKNKNKTKGDYGQLDLALDLGMSERTLRKRRAEHNFTRNECFCIGFALELEISELNKLLRENNNVELGYDGRDGFIRLLLQNGYDLEEAEEKLTRKGYDSLFSKD